MGDDGVLTVVDFIHPIHEVEAFARRLSIVVGRPIRVLPAPPKLSGPRTAENVAELFKAGGADLGVI